MDKENNTLQKLKKQELQKLFTNDRRALLREVKKRFVIQRRRKLKSCSTLLQAAKLYLVKRLSFRRLAYQMAVLYGIKMSDTAWKKQLSKFAPAFLEAAQAIFERKLRSSGMPQQVGLDATHFSMEGKDGSIFRVHTSMFLELKTVDQLILTDQHVAESVKNFLLRDGCCYLADRAYGNAPQMAHMMERGVDFIFRISPSRVKLFADAACRERIDCRTLLSGEAFSICCFFQYRHKVYPIQLVGSILPVEKRDAAQKRAKRKSGKRQHKIKPETLIWANWMLLATSLPDPGPHIYEAYRLRWQIELFFKTAKSLLNFHKLRRCSIRCASSVIMIWMAFVFCISSLYLKADSTFQQFPSFFFSFDFLLALFP